MAINKKQAALYMEQRQKHKTQAKSAAQADISERTARRVDNGQHCSQQPIKPREYSTRKDPLAAVWEGEIKPMLINQPRLLPVTLFEYLQDKYPGKYDHCQRTLQDGASAASTSEQIAAAFILNNMTLLPYQYNDVIVAWQRLGNQWQGYVTDIKAQHMARIVKRNQH